VPASGRIKVATGIWSGSPNVITGTGPDNPGQSHAAAVSLTTATVYGNGRPGDPAPRKNIAQMNAIQPRATMCTLR